MAYLRDLSSCRGCSARPAVVVLVGRFNEDLGAYCRRCGGRALEVQAAGEEKAKTREAEERARGA